jgi:streptomycin 6-kinase
MAQIPKEFIRTINELYDKPGSEWLINLPALIVDCERRWCLTVGAPFLPLSYNYVAPGVREDGTEVVLKLGYPNLALRMEIEALKIYGGRGATQLFASDIAQGILLLERLSPGTPLSKLDNDEQATSITTQVMRQLWRPVPLKHYFPTVADWASGLSKLRLKFCGTCGPLPEGLVAQAEGIFNELIESMAEPVLLHGDLHHNNILNAERQPWMAIDPKGLVGEPAYEVGALLRNKLPQPFMKAEAGRILARRIAQISEELGFDQQRLRNWGIAQAVLSAWWSLEDHGYGWESAIACAEVLAALEI